MYHGPKSLETDRKELKVESILACGIVRGEAAHSK